MTTKFFVGKSERDRGVLNKQKAAAKQTGPRLLAIAMERAGAALRVSKVLN